MKSKNKSIRELNAEIRAAFDGVKDIKHYQGPENKETYVKVDRMPNTDKPGWIFAGWTDNLRLRNWPEK